MAYSQEHFTNELWPMLVTMDQFYAGGKQSEVWVYRFEIPFATFTAGTWIVDNVPVRGLASPTELAGGAGAVLSRRFAYREVPGYVVVVLTCGWAGLDWFDSLTRVSCRSVTMREKRIWSIDENPKELSGPVMTDADSRETQRYAIDDDEYEDVTYVQINITSIVSSIPALWQGTNFNKRNQAEVTIRGMKYPAGKVLYTGGSTEDVPASQSPTGSAQYRMNLVLLAGSKAWPLTVNRYIETLTSVVVDVKNSGVAKGKNRVTKWVRPATATDAATIRGEFDMAGAIASLP